MAEYAKKVVLNSLSGYDPDRESILRTLYDPTGTLYGNTKGVWPDGNGFFVYRKLFWVFPFCFLLAERKSCAFPAVSLKNSRRLRRHLEA